MGSDRGSKPSKAASVCDDPFLLEEQRSEEERAMRNTARAYARTG
jgi:hypothetical protein